MNSINRPSNENGFRPFSRLLQLWSDFHYVRHHAGQPLEGVTFHGNGRRSFRMMASTIRYAEACERTPSWLVKLAVLTAKRGSNPR